MEGSSVCVLGITFGGNLVEEGSYMDAGGLVDLECAIVGGDSGGLRGSHGEGSIRLSGQGASTRERDVSGGLITTEGWR